MHAETDWHWNAMSPAERMRAATRYKLRRCRMAKKHTKLRCEGGV